MSLYQYIRWEIFQSPNWQTLAAFGAQLCRLYTAGSTACMCTPHSPRPELVNPELLKDRRCLAFAPATALLVNSTISSSLCLQFVDCRDRGTCSRLTFRLAIPSGRSCITQGCLRICCTVMRLSGSTSSSLVRRSVHSAVSPCTQIRTHIR